MMYECYIQIAHYNSYPAHKILQTVEKGWASKEGCKLREICEKHAENQENLHFEAHCRGCNLSFWQMIT